MRERLQLTSWESRLRDFGILMNKSEICPEIHVNVDVELAMATVVDHYERPITSSIEAGSARTATWKPCLQLTIASEVGRDP